ncbi:hypothetical protein [Methylobacterium marchantiae]|uniref:DUF3489 domain-containing protein n=1 Tax=Methylobacterium marchantiae TaxID=600331 RepID=A0ABW3X236_9HYPH|nr:hypothetical protein AIGOOFII_1347 [Methylobacterium marchantiae]
MASSRGLSRIVRIDYGWNARVNDAIRRSRIDTFERTASGLLTKRANLYGEAMRLRDRMAEIENETAAIDRVLKKLGYEDDQDTAMPCQKCKALFGRAELTRGILDTLGDATGPMTSREVAQSVLSLSGHDARDRGLMTAHTRRASKALRLLKEGGTIAQSNDVRGNVLWRVRRQ